MINKEKFYIPKDQVESYDGDTLRFRISEEEAQSRFIGDYPPSSSSATANEGLTAARKAERNIGENKEETTVPLTEERLDASKRESTKEATITKEPVTETKTVEVPVTHEEISVERKPVSSSSSSSSTTTAERPVQSRTETKVPLKQEEVQVTKQPYVKEEVSVKKKPVTETRRISDKVTSEKVKVKGTSGEEEE
jgi:uncharacterized protein (TIGR02271 family)